MSIATANLIVTLVGVYLATGLILGIFMISAGLGRFDPAARSMSWRVRLLLLPGLIGLWPFMLVKFLRRQGPPVQ